MSPVLCTELIVEIIEHADFSDEKLCRIANVCSYLRDIVLLSRPKLKEVKIGLCELLDYGQESTSDDVSPYTLQLSSDEYLATNILKKVSPLLAAPNLVKMTVSSIRSINNIAPLRFLPPRSSKLTRLTLSYVDIPIRAMDQLFSCIAALTHFNLHSALDDTSHISGGSVPLREICLALHTYFHDTLEELSLMSRGPVAWGTESYFTSFIDRNGQYYTNVETFQRSYDRSTKYIGPSLLSRFSKLRVVELPFDAVISPDPSIPKSFQIIFPRSIEHIMLDALRDRQEYINKYGRGDEDEFVEDLVEFDRTASRRAALFNRAGQQKRLQTPKRHLLEFTWKRSRPSWRAGMAV